MSEDYGLKISIEGKDVFNSTDLETSFKNDYSLLKVAMSGSGTLSNPGGTATITHNLGYVPQFLVFMEGRGGTTNLSTGDVFDQTVSGADTTTLKLFGPSSGSYQYYIFYEPIDGSTQQNLVSSNNYGMKVMKPGYNITSTDLTKQSLNSEKNNLKIALTGTYSTTSPDTDYYTVQVAHGLPYIPGFMVFIQTNNDGKWYFGTSGKNLSYTSTDGTNLNFTYFNVPGGQNVKVFYVLFVENSI